MSTFQSLTYCFVLYVGECKRKWDFVSRVDAINLQEMGLWFPSNTQSIVPILINEVNCNKGGGLLKCSYHAFTARLWTVTLLCFSLLYLYTRGGKSVEMS